MKKYILVILLMISVCAGGYAQFNCDSYTIFHRFDTTQKIYRGHIRVDSIRRAQHIMALHISEKIKGNFSLSCNGKVFYTGMIGADARLGYERYDMPIDPGKKEQELVVEEGNLRRAVHLTFSSAQVHLVLDVDSCALTATLANRAPMPH